MSLRVCSEPGCPNLQAETRCVKHRREREQQRGTSGQRGYGYAHQQERARWAPLVAAGRVKCWRCRTLIAADDAWDLGHDDMDRTRYHGPEHQRCNRSTASRTPPRA